ncbi:hypothetical protein BCR39DRAFT_523035 [Naematelia encephala]|uniref:Uncharacterized protein n=1 Tax=Naematelia encephala TaxID=71784 RepID=A0A1Y2BDM3_9TREE|nr:hypothetical protein BCR39DRAFT_523035 [Naematelia encephala]
MSPPSRTTGLPYHLAYPIISLTLLAVSAFASADSVWYCSANTATQVIRFAGQNYCGYNVSNLVITAKLGCIFRGWQYQIPDNYFGFPLPANVSNNLSKAAVLSVVSFSLVLVSGAHHAYTIRYSYRVSPAPNADKLYSLTQIHFITVTVCFVFTLVAFVVEAAIIGHAVGSTITTDEDTVQVAVYWGQSPWLVLAAGVVHVGWGYEAVRWRTALLK